VCHLARSWGIHIWSTKLTAPIQIKYRPPGLFTWCIACSWYLFSWEWPRRSCPTSCQGSCSRHCTAACLLWKCFSERGWWGPGSINCPGDGHFQRKQRGQHAQPYGWRDPVSHQAHQASSYAEPTALLTDVHLICSYRLPGLGTTRHPQAAHTENNLHLCYTSMGWFGVYSNSPCGVRAGDPVR